jgi:hypothetical protein
MSAMREPPRERGARRWTAVVGPLALVAILFAVAATGRWPRDRVLWAGCGIVLAGLTLVRPWWFWEHSKARWLRGLVGDEAAAVFYLLVAAACLYAGLVGGWTFGRR